LYYARFGTEPPVIFTVSPSIFSIVASKLFDFSSTLPGNGCQNGGFKAFSFS
jgi:hypothetical protein